jgi:D-alanyl-lipoteichoic acid acyltransferase DltB (MBOAT superfamily)
MNIASIDFLLFAVAAVALPAVAGRLRPWVFLGINLWFLGSFAKGPAELFPLAAFLLLGYGAARLAAAHHGSRHGRALGNGLVLALALLFLYLRRYSVLAFVPALPEPYVTIGLSYILFRLLQVVLDARDGALGGKDLRPLAYANYTLSFLTLVSGPIQRYQDFLRQDAAPARLTAPRLDAALGRMGTGFFKLLLLADVLLRVHGKLGPDLVHSLAQGAGVAPALGAFCAAAATYALYLYCNFSGSIDVVVGVGVLLGYDLPENFDRPLTSANFLDFWSRWHMTLANWFKFYLFNPFLGALLRRWPAPAMRNGFAVLAFFVTFFFVGAWHGTTSMFLLCGVALGLGVSVNKLWQVRVRAWLGRKRHKALNGSRPYTWLCRGLTFAYFSLSLFAFWLTPEQARTLFAGRSFVLMNLAALGAIALAATPVYALVGLAEGPFAALRRAFARGRLGPGALLAAKIALALALVMGEMGGAPNFVYGNF